MSTDHQQYSISNQSDVISAYASAHQMLVVRSYEDSGKSGLTLRERRGLCRLLEDVETGRADYSVVLVYDVSRWGRFQDTDESAYYEYRCRKAKIDVHYCAEPFANDGSISATLLKAIKRAMAGEYSRELSVKVFAGKCRLIDLGFRQGGPAGFGLRRLLIDQNRRPKGILSRGEQKNLLTDRVILVPGPEDEIKIVRDVFRLFTEERIPPKKIAGILNRRGILSEQRRPWSRYMIYDMVTNPKYIGTNVSNRTSCKLHKNYVKNPPEMWVRRDNAFAPIIDFDTFEKAQRITAARAHRYTNEELRTALEGLLKRTGHLSLKLIRRDRNMPSPEVYEKHFGGLMGAYKAIGFVQQGDFSYLEGARRLHALNKEIALRFADRLTAMGATLKPIKGGAFAFTVNEEFTVRLKVARSYYRAGISKWTLRLSDRSDTDMTVIARIGPDNESVLDYYIVPRVHHFAMATRLSFDNGFHTDTFRFADLSFLVNLARRVTLERHHETANDHQHSDCADSSSQSSLSQ